MATSLDGKIGPANVDRFVAIGSQYDMENLIALRDTADGILFGANTFRAWPRVHRGNNPKRNAHHFIMSHSLDLDFGADLFQHPEIPITIFSGAGNMYPESTLPSHINIVSIPDQANQIQLILEYINTCGVKTLMVEGGGHILHAFLAAKALDELYLTLVPVIIGDEGAPALLGGQSLDAPPHVELRQSRQVGNETFLHLELRYT